MESINMEDERLNRDAAFWQAEKDKACAEMKELDRLRASNAELLAALEWNHDYLMSIKDYDGYEETDLCKSNLKAIANARSVK